MATRIQLRRDTAANWAVENPILADGEKGIEKDTNKEKTGDGVTPWNSLVYFGLGGDTTTGLTVSEQATTPETPAGGFGTIYPKADGRWYFLDDSGVEHKIKTITDIGSRIVGDLVNSANVIDINWDSLNDFNSSNRVAISANTSITYTNATNAQFATFKVLISNLATITFPVGSISGDSRVSSRVFTPLANGNYTISIYKTSTEYEVVISINPAI